MKFIIVTVCKLNDEQQVRPVRNTAVRTDQIVIVDEPLDKLEEVIPRASIVVLEGGQAFLVSGSPKEVLESIEETKLK